MKSNNRRWLTAYNTMDAEVGYLRPVQHDVNYVNKSWVTLALNQILVHGKFELFDRLPNKKGAIAKAEKSFIYIYKNQFLNSTPSRVIKNLDTFEYLLYLLSKEVWRPPLCTQYCFAELVLIRFHWFGLGAPDSRITACNPFSYLIQAWLRSFWLTALTAICVLCLLSSS